MKEQCQLEGCDKIANFTGYCWYHRARKPIKKPPFKIRKSKSLRTIKPTDKVKELEKILDTLFAQYIKLRDTDELGYGFCPTSGKLIHYRKVNDLWTWNCHCSHLIKRRFKQLRWDEHNAFAQYSEENILKDGNEEVARKYMNNRFGKVIIDAIYRRKYLTTSYSQPELELKIEIYKEKVKNLLKTKRF